MRLAAFTLQGLDLSSIPTYRAGLLELIRRTEADLVVLPAYSALVLGCACGKLQLPGSFIQLLREAPVRSELWIADYLDLHANLASRCSVYLVPGTWLAGEDTKIYHRTCCFDPAGKVIAGQDQTHLTRAEKEAGLSGGNKLELFTCGDLKTGLLLGNDARHPETGRHLALCGADLVLHCGALPGSGNCWIQAAGIWAQVQQNQFWAVEAQLCNSLAGNHYATEPIIHGPCEITPGQSGFLARGSIYSPFVTATLDQPARLALKEQYPLLKLLNPAAYTELQTSPEGKVKNAF